MTQPGTAALIVGDGSGWLYVVPLSVLAAHRVPEGGKSAVQRLLDDLASLELGYHWWGDTARYRAAWYIPDGVVPMPSPANDEKRIE